MLRFSGPELALLVSGAVCVVVAGFVLMVFALGLVWFVRRRRPSATARQDALEAVGFRRAGTGWSMPLYGTALVFDDGKAGWCWTVRLPRYNTLTLQVEERDSGIVPEGRVFEVGHPGLDARFVMAAERSAQTQALVGNRTFANAMLAMPFLSLKLKGDELILVDPTLKGLAKRSGGSVVLGTPKTIAAECDVHQAVAVLTTALFDSLYSKQTGTILPEHR